MEKRDDRDVVGAAAGSGIGCDSAGETDGKDSFQRKKKRKKRESGTPGG